MAFFRSLFALLRRNFIYRKRRWLASIFEFILPVAAVAILVGIKKAVESSSNFTPKEIPAKMRGTGPFDTISPFTFQDYVTALQAKRRCIKAPYGDFYTISGIDQFTWPVPFVKCDSRKCKADGESAVPYCEYNVLAVAPSDFGDATARARVNSFMIYIRNRYPQLAPEMEVGEEGTLPFDYDFIQEFRSPDDIDTYVRSEEYGTSTSHPKIGFAVVLSPGDANSYSYSLRMNSTNFNSPENEARPVSATMPSTARVFDSFAKTERDACSTRGGAPFLGYAALGNCVGQYVVNGALPIQRLVDDWILWETGAESDGVRVSNGGVSFAYFPTQAYVEQGFYALIAQFVPLLVVLGLLYPIAACVRSVVQEKELRQKELMKMMSVSDAAIGWSWFLSLYSFLFLSALPASLAADALFANSDWILLFIFWEVAFLASLMFVFVVAACFSRGTRAVLVGLLLYFVGYFLTLALDYQTSSVGLVFLVSLHPVTAYSYGLQVIGNLEDAGVGLRWSTVGFSDFPSGFTFRDVMGFLFFDCIIWGVLSWYLNRVIKGDYGRPYPWYFPFTKQYWCPGSAASGDTSEVADADVGIPIEPASEALRAQANNVHIRGLTKKYGEKVAVDGLNLSLYSGQVTALLGHNGAGKTTTISMLTGMVEPTSGYAVISGKDIRTQMPLIRENIGICLQHDCLFPQLTVKEHIQFFARIKGLYGKVSRVEAEKMVMDAIEDVALLEKRNTYSKNLSGGMKRKLSVAIAFCGGSKTVFLDEPTSGMDPFSRRFTWNVIRQYRQDRCIILTTHFMDEADILGDRIAIMGEGQLRCAGSSLFLKKRYGVGYQLTIEKKSGTRRARTAAEGLISMSPDSAHSNHRDSGAATVEATVANIVKGNVAAASLLSNVGTELSYQLPLDSSSKFVRMFEGLDRLVDNDVIVTYGVSITTLDEVFLMVARGDMGREEALASVRGAGKEDAFTEEMNRSHRTRPDLSGNAVFSRHVRALFAKRAMNFKRDKKAWCCSTVCPSLFAMIGFLIVMLIPSNRNMPALTLTLDANNPNVKSDERNPIPFNEAGRNFTCRPGQCIASPVNEVESTGEKYYYCGAEAQIDAGGAPCSGRECSIPSCTISLSNEIVDQITEHGAFPVADRVSNVSESSYSLFISSSSFAASQYGALYFAQDTNSIIQSGASYGISSASACITSNGNYTDRDSCKNYVGTGFVVTTNFTSLHASLLYQAVADEALVRNYRADNSFSISATIHPLPITKQEEGFASGEDAFTAWFLLVLSFPFVTGAWATFIVTERKSKAKHLQTVAGVKPAAYWLSSYFWDIMNYQLPLWIIVMLMFAFDVTAFTTTEKGVIGGTLAALVLFGPAAAGFTYIFSFLFGSPSMCNLAIIVFNFLIGMVGPIVVFVLRLIGTDGTLDDAQKYLNSAIAVEWILRFFPMFNLSKALFFVINIESISLAFQKPDISVWDTDVLLIEVLYLAAQSILYVLVAIKLDKLSTNPRAVQIWRTFIKYITCRCFCGRAPTHPSGAQSETSTPTEDEDVAAESERVLSGRADHDLILLKDLTKQYANGKLAVDHMSFGIPPGMCFGLLGINGAGKTTTMAMLTAEFPPTSGDAILAGYSITTEPEQTRKRIGYCPQFDAHFMNMTGREHVELYASIKGIPKKAVKEAAAAKLAEVGLSEYDSNRLSGGYSGGMKRKLSVACATIGQPQIVFLDEPSTGMDPVARRDLWEVISKMVVGHEQQAPEDKTSVILTTHSMEECEALCPIIGIMAGGKLRCLGSAQRLKSRFGKNFQVEMKCLEVNPEDDDFRSILASLSTQPEINAVSESMEVGGAFAESTFLNLDQVLSALRSLTEDDYLASMITPENPNGYIIHKAASSVVGSALNEVTAFCVEELRVKAVIDFFAEKYPNSILRERQETKVRYEIPSEGLKISALFGAIEERKVSLKLADYGVSQTTLEQVFNMHAAEAEQAKHDTVD